MASLVINVFSPMLVLTDVVIISKDMALTASENIILTDAVTVRFNKLLISVNDAITLSEN